MNFIFSWSRKDTAFLVSRRTWSSLGIQSSSGKTSWNWSSYRCTRVIVAVLVLLSPKGWEVGRGEGNKSIRWRKESEKFSSLPPTIDRCSSVQVWRGKSLGGGRGKCDSSLVRRAYRHEAWGRWSTAAVFDRQGFQSNLKSSFSHRCWESQSRS